MQLPASNAEMANDGIDALAGPSQSSSLLRQPGLYPCDRSPADPADLCELAPRVQGYDLGQERRAIGIAADDERGVSRIRHQLNDPVRQFRAGSGGTLVSSFHATQIYPQYDAIEGSNCAANQA